MPDGRIDYDAPKNDEAYVIRLEHADGRRAKSVVTFREIGLHLGVPPAEMIAMKARNLGEQMPHRSARR